MKIAFIVPTSLTEWGGVESYVFELANSLSKNHHVLVFSNGIVHKKRMDKLPMHSFHYKELPTVSFNLINPSLTIPRLPKWINNYEFAYVYHIGIVYSYFAMLHLKVPKVLGIHFDILSNPDLWQYPTKVIFRSIKILLKHANGVCCRTNYYASLLQNNLGIDAKKIFVIPECVNTDIFSPRKRKNHFTVLFVGRLSSDKGIEVILKIVNKTREDINWVFLGTGEKKYEIQIEKLSRKKPNVTWKGFLSHQRLAEELSKASVTIVPSKGGEGYSNIVLQSLACGTPVVLSKIPPFSEFVSKAPSEICTLFQFNKPGDLLYKIISWKNLIETDQEKYDKICSKARMYIEKNFSLSVAKTNFESMINMLCENKLPYLNLKALSK